MLTGKCDDRKVVSSTLEQLTSPTGGKQQYRRLALKFAPLSYNGNTVERRALISATSVGGTVFILVAGSLAEISTLLHDAPVAKRMWAACIAVLDHFLGRAIGIGAAVDQRAVEAHVAELVDDQRQIVENTVECTA